MFGTFVLQETQFHFLNGYCFITLSYLPWLKYCLSATDRYRHNVSVPYSMY